MTNLLEQFRKFNSKERFFLIGAAFDNINFSLSDNFSSRLRDVLSINITNDAFNAMDYHLDWIWASLIFAFTDKKNIISNDSKIIKGNQEDIDFLIAFQDGNIYHVILIEAKGVTSWDNKQMKSKAERLTNIFGEKGTHWPKVVPHFVLMSKNRPQKLDLSFWPEWMKPNNELHWLPIDIPNDLVKVTRCNKNGKSDKNGQFWTQAKR